MKILLSMAALILLQASYAFAYIDPNTGGYVFQFLFPIFAAITAGYVFFKNQIKRLLAKCCLLFKKPESKQ